MKKESNIDNDEGHELLINRDPLGYTFKQPEMSPWKCYMFGSRPGGYGMVYQPQKGQVPNRFVRWMMKICFDCTWVKEDQSPDI